MSKSAKKRKPKTKKQALEGRRNALMSGLKMSWSSGNPKACTADTITTPVVTHKSPSFSTAAKEFWRQNNELIYSKQRWCWLVTAVSHFDGPFGTLELTSEIEHSAVIADLGPAIQGAVNDDVDSMSGTNNPLIKTVFTIECLGNPK